MKWFVSKRYFTIAECETAREAAEHILENCDSDYYDEMLDECYGEIEVCGWSYPASQVLSEVDPIAYRCGRSDWEDATASDIEYELERMDDGEELYFYGFDVKCIEDDEEDEEEE